jgi:acyl-CoA reductase-like NAD-dependent aldehyde dehydrogenase
MSEYKMWIGGKWIGAESGKTYPVFNPANGMEIAQLPLGGKADVDKAVDAARKAFPIWSKKPQSERSQVAMKIASLLRENAKELGMIDTLDHGTPVKTAAATVAGKAVNFEWAAYLQHEPIGVVALITPWNFPLSMILVKLAPALTLGNTCIIKPPSIDSLAALKLAELLEKLELPPGTINVITGPGSTVGESLASHRGVDMVSFTGSCETGKQIMALASQTVKRLHLELGGKNPVIILEDADINTAANAMAARQFSNAGQICACPGRFYVHEKVYDEFLEKFTAATQKLVVGDPGDEKTDMGPLVSAEHRDRVEGYIRSGLDEGAKIVMGGQKPTALPMKNGYFVMPMIFTNATQKMKIAREEIFGPVAVFMEKFNSDAKVIEMANDSTFGLCSYIWTRDMARGMRFANEIAVGTVWLSNALTLAPELPWTGYKESGIGEENSLYGLLEYTNLKRVHVDLTLTK